jgi:hypothetical protein
LCLPYCKEDNDRREGGGRRREGERDGGRKGGREGGRESVQSIKPIILALANDFQ